MQLRHASDSTTLALPGTPQSMCAASSGGAVAPGQAAPAAAAAAPPGQAGHPGVAPTIPVAPALPAQVIEGSYYAPLKIGKKEKK